MTRILLFLLVSAAALLLQSGPLYQAAPGGVTVDLVFLLTVSLGMSQGPVWGAAGGALNGLLLGALAGGDVAAPLSLAYADVGVAAGFMGGQPWSQRPRGIMTASALLTVGLLGLEALLFESMGLPHGIHLIPAILLTAYHAVLAWPLVAWMRWRPVERSRVFDRPRRRKRTLLPPVVGGTVR